jgi:hypothetical protein
MCYDPTENVLFDGNQELVNCWMKCIEKLGNYAGNNSAYM